ncbi:MAG: hypothetical protein EXR27_17235 [Betaproteobacteria bacterium]|nr:hypothetical protein [Betaproteobacteria bacterium]
MMRDYWLSKLFFDVQTPDIGAEYRANREKVLARYQIRPEVLAAVRADDVKFLAKRVNPYLLRFYFHVAGMSERDFVDKLRGSDTPNAMETEHV